jgi:predicted ATPase/DNA-binding CsgD family transcriptional regulator
VGRDAILDDVIERVAANRAVTLTGAGGVGKTTLALEVAAAMATHFADGVWLIELAPVGDPASIADAIAAVLGIAPQGETPMIEVVASAIAGRHLLLILDNCEHLSPAIATAVELLLARSSHPKILATSRENLWLGGEHRCSVAPLDLRGGAASDAVRLFVERAQSVRPEFSVSEPTTADAVVEICRTVDGLPLGIELAASRMASMSAVELRERLEHRFRLLTGAEHRPERQRTLHHMVAWSTDLLTDEERAVLATASVFAGGFGLADLVELMPGTDEVDVLVRLDSLVHKSLLVATPQPAGTRYRLLETIRQSTQEKLVGTEAMTALRDRHATYFGRRSAAQWDGWNGPGWGPASAWVVTELANLRAAFRWSSDRGNVVVATDVAAHAALIGLPAHTFEPVAWAEELIEAGVAADVARLPRLYTGAGYACFAGRPVAAAANAHRATELELLPTYDPCEPGLATFTEALASVYSGDLPRYVELSARVAALPGSARAYGLPAYVDGLQASGRVDEALALTEESVAAARELGNPFWIVYALWTAGLAHANVDARRALSAWDEGVEVAREHRVTFFEGFLARDAARLHAADGDVDVALGLFVTAIDSFQTSGNVAQLIITVASLPALLERLARPETAVTLYAAITQEPAAVDHVPELTVIGERVRRAVSPAALATCEAAGAALDLSGAATYARSEIMALVEDQRRGGTAEQPGGLTRRELEVLRLVADGMTTAEIASRLFISAKTADHHIQHIYTKAGVNNRAAITRWALEHQVVTAPIG